MKQIKHNRTRRRAFSPAILLTAALLIILAVFFTVAVIPSGTSSIAGKGTASDDVAISGSDSGIKEADFESQNEVFPENDTKNPQKTDTAAGAEATPPSGGAATGPSAETGARPSSSGENGNMPDAGSNENISVPPQEPSVPKTPENQEQTDGRYAYLTFDDGPSRNTEKILQILAENDVKATFFVIGRTDETSMQRYRMIAEAGHTLAMHSYTHNYGEIYASMDAFREDFRKISDLLTQITGSRPLLYRFPGGSSNTLSSRKVPMTEMVQFLKEQDVQYFDWNVNSADASGRNPAAGLLVQNVKNGLKYRHNIVLMHDAAGHETTVDALPDIIRACRDKGLTFRTIEKDTPPSHHHRRD